MADLKSFPNQFNQTVNFTSTGADFGFGFNAGHVSIRNPSAKSIYITLNSTTGGTTGGFEIASSNSLEFGSIGVGIAGASFVATSSGGSMQIGAWG